MMQSVAKALPKGVHLGVSPLSWANDVLEDLGADIPLETCLREGAGAGYSGVELGRKFPRYAATLAPILGAHGLALVSGWYSGELAERSVAEEIAAVSPHAALLRDMGCKVMVYGEVAMMAESATLDLGPLDLGMSTRKIMPRADVPAYAARLTAFAKHLRVVYGLTLAYHHHLMMVAETFDEIVAIFAAAGPELGLLLDTGHAIGAGFEYTRLIDVLGHRIVHIHLKDMRAEIMAQVRAGDMSFNDGVRAGMFTVPGDGCVNFAPLVQFVCESGYQGWLVVEAEQDPAKAPPKAAVTRAHDTVSSIFAKVSA